MIARAGAALALASWVLVLALASASAADVRQWSWLGVRIRDLSEQETEEIAARHGIREGFGVVIVEVIEGAPAANAGLKSGDIVVAFGKRPVTETRMLQRLIATAPTDRESELTVLRPEGRRLLRVRLTSMPRAMVGERISAEFGFLLRDPEVQGGEATGRVGTTVPAIASVIRGGAADRAGLEAGDVILQVNEQPVLSRDGAREALADASPERPLSLTVRRGGSRLSVTLPSP